MGDENEFATDIMRMVDARIARALEVPTGITPGVHSGITFDRYGRALLGAGSGSALIGGSTTSANNDTDTTVTWDNSNSWGHNSNSIWSVGTPTRLFAPYSAYYTVYTNSEWSSNATGYRCTLIRKLNTSGVNQGTIVQTRLQAAVSGLATAYQTFVPRFYLAAGESIDVQIRQTSGGALALNSASWVSLALIG